MNRRRPPSRWIDLDRARCTFATLLRRVRSVPPIAHVVRAIVLASPASVDIGIKLLFNWVVVGRIAAMRRDYSPSRGEGSPCWNTKCALKIARSRACGRASFIEVTTRPCVTSRPSDARGRPGVHTLDVVGGTVALPRMVSLTKLETAILRVMTRGTFRDGDRSVRNEMGTRR